MGKFKDKNGKTKIGKFLQGIAKVGPGVLKFAGNLTGINALEKLGKALDKDTEMSEVDKAAAKAILEFEIQEMQEITKRHAADMASDSWLSKNIRPMTLIALVLSLIIWVALDSSIKGFKVGTEWIDLYKILLLLAFGFYYGGREIQKGIINWNKRGR